MQKSPADDFSVGRGCDFVPPRSFAEGLDPVGDFLLCDGGGEALALLPVAGAGERCELRATLADAAAGGGAEGNDRLAGEVIGCYEGIHRPGGDAPPDGVAKKHGVGDKIDFYADMAKSFLCDKDAPEDKLARYYEYIVRG